jgi:predicted ferric reductase
LSRLDQDRALTRSPGLSGKVLSILYVTAAGLPMIAAMMSKMKPDIPLNEFGTAFGLTGAALLFLQFLSSGRYESLSGRIGIDRTMGFHRIAAYVLLGFVVLHPLSYLATTFLSHPRAALNHLTGMLLSKRLRTGVVAMAGLVVMVAFATFRSRPFMRYEDWRGSHGLFAIAVTALALHHLLVVGNYSAEWPLRLLWFFFASVALVAIGLIYVVRPWRMWREDWRVEQVRPLGERIWEMMLHGPETTRLRFRAGQFIWMTLAPHRPPFHDHPFSIASSSTDLPRLRLVIREAGDCTSGFGRIEPGTRVAVDGPHGSFVLPQGKEPVIMVAGGVGIAPLLGMLEEAAAKTDARSFRLLYAARNPSALAGLERLRELQSRLDLSIQCVVEEGVEGSGCSIGPIGHKHLSQLLTGAHSEDVKCLVCGPAVMMEAVTDALLAENVPANAIQYERFDYAAGKGHLDRARRREALLVFVILLLGIAAFSLR